MADYLSMNRVLIVEPDDYDGLRGELDEVGINYDIATEDEASELFTRIEYDAVVGPEDDELYVRTLSDDTPFLVYDDLNGSSNATDRLLGDAEFDARRVAAYTGVEGLESYTKDVNTIVEGHDDLDLFLDMFEHDVRNNIHVAEAYCGLIDVNTEDEDRKETVNERLRSINRLIDTISTARNIGGRRENKEEINLSSTFERLESSYETMASQNDFELDFSIEEDITVSAGPLLDDMYGQLIENSINHSEGSRIHVTAEDRENPVVVFEDDGGGIPEEIQDNLFQEGVKGKKTGNTGIGTTLVDNIADRYDIDVEVGESEMGGAMFKLEHESA